MHNLTQNSQLRRLAPDGTAATTFILAAGTTDVNSGSVDMDGYEAVRFVLGLGTIAASGSVSVKVQQSSDNAATDDYTDIAGTAQGATADTDDNKMIIVDIYRPTKRYLRLVTTRGDGGNSTIDFLLAELYRPANAPVAAHSTVYGQEIFNSPAEGTA